ncbi:MAG TPA: M23 family metallopeptidase [Candidatus Evtepia faecigallinarum]|nr:M23 family metallopeptidase [Candidatus Evtepia faecigallinarum]
MNFPLLKQIFQQMWGLVVLEHRYGGRLPGPADYRSPRQYSLPFRGAWTVVNGGVTKETSHSWDIPTQRYAYDFLILDEEGRSFQGDETDPAAFYCYGQDILAPADGVVAEVLSGQPDSRITKDRKASCQARDLRGNHILLDHGQGEFSLLAHLQPDSILVTVGQQVRRGEALARCGNSGNSSEPHLHFQLQQGASFTASPGLPIPFASLDVSPAPHYARFDDRMLAKNHPDPWPPYLQVGQRAANPAPEVGL